MASLKEDLAFAHSLGDDDFYDGYFMLIDPIWRAYFKGLLEPGSREKLLEPFRKRLHKIQLARNVPGAKGLLV